MKSKLVFLGTGGSMGVPMIGCSCSVCQSQDSHNRRLRSSALLQIGEKRFLIDASPDFREQALRVQLKQLSGVLITHSHYDHVGGMDDLRVFHILQKVRLPCYLSEEAFGEIKNRYAYFFRPISEQISVSPQLDFHVLKEDTGRFTCDSVTFKYLTFFQPGTKVTGYRLGDLAYVSDIRTYSESVFDELAGVEILILSALRWTPSPMHFSIDEAVAFARKVGAKKTYFTHIAHELDHRETNAKLPPDIRLAYDGLEIPFHVKET